MTKNLTAREVKEQFSLVDLLSRLGYRPVPGAGRERMYLSMLRDTDTRPSFSVNDGLGVWFDHGLGQGGNIIDFGLAYWRDLNFAEVIRKIQEVCDAQPAVQQARPRQSRPRIPLKAQPVIREVKPLGAHPAITDYLRSRGVYEVARFYLSEVHYFIEDAHCVRRHYFAAGWLNEHRAWEVRNRYFKGCVGHKGITVIPGHPKIAALFEGFIDFLSWRLEHPEAEHTIIVLNTLALLSTGIDRAKAYATLELYFDRDPAGYEATRQFLEALPYAADRSLAYEGFNDYNEKIMARAKTERSPRQEPERTTATVSRPVRR